MFRFLATFPASAPSGFRVSTIDPGTAEVADRHLTTTIPLPHGDSRCSILCSRVVTLPVTGLLAGEATTLFG